MKNKKGSMARKGLYFILSLIFIAVTLGSAVGIVFLESYGFYEMGDGSESVEETLRDKAYGNYAIRVLASGEGRGEYATQELTDTNYRYAIIENLSQITDEDFLFDPKNYSATNLSEDELKDLKEHRPKNYLVETYDIGKQTSYNLTDTLFGYTTCFNESDEMTIELSALGYDRNAQQLYLYNDKTEKFYKYGSYTEDTYTLRPQGAQIDSEEYPYGIEKLELPILSDALKNEIMVVYSDYGFYIDASQVYDLTDQDDELIDASGEAYAIYDDRTFSLSIEDPTIHPVTVLSMSCDPLDMTKNDMLVQAERIAAWGSVARTYLPIAMIVSGVLSIICYVLLLCQSGYHKVDGEVVLERRGLDYIPVDIAFGAAFTIVALLIGVFVEVTRNIDTGYMISMVILDVVIVLSGIAAALLYSMTLASNVKHSGWWRHSACYGIVHGIGRFLRWCRSTISNSVRGLKMGTRIWAIFAAVCILEFLGIAYCSSAYRPGNLMLLWMIEKAIFVVGLAAILKHYARLKAAAAAIASGDMSAYVDTTGMPIDLKEQGDSLNRIRGGFEDAIRKRLKSERFQTELITNVSHDIKTPLTSIISYVDLLKKEKLPEGKLTEYIDILSRQAERLKKLLNDLLDASKASTGNVELNLTDVDVNVLLSQTVGEFEERLKKNQIDLKVKTPNTTARIKADSRYLWRVLDNLMNNIVKYAQEGTRAYINLEVRDARVILTFLNTSREELNISSDELLSRFVRGDRSRNTEGSGLGLSIAKSLTELMGGTFILEVEGDLFKVKLQF